MPEICDYVCFFCLDVEAFSLGEGEFDKAYEFLIGPLDLAPVNKAVREEAEGSGTYSDNDVVDYDGGIAPDYGVADDGDDDGNSEVESDANDGLEEENEGKDNESDGNGSNEE